MADLHAPGAITHDAPAAEKAGRNPADIGYMPLPVLKGDGHCATLVSDYQQAVNVHSEDKEAARAWIDWFTEKSGYSAEEGAVPTLKSAPMPSTLKDFVDNDVTFRSARRRTPAGQRHRTPPDRTPSPTTARS
ncbi:sugar ABC transporter substrate-binding protein [Streptomyces badius]